MWILWPIRNFCASISPLSEVFYPQNPVIFIRAFQISSAMSAKAQRNIYIRQMNTDMKINAWRIMLWYYPLFIMLILRYNILEPHDSSIFSCEAIKAWWAECKYRLHNAQCWGLHKLHAGGIFNCSCVQNDVCFEKKNETQDFSSNFQLWTFFFNDIIDIAFNDCPSETTHGEETQPESRLAPHETAEKGQIHKWVSNGFVYLFEKWKLLISNRVFRGFENFGIFIQKIKIPHCFQLCAQQFELICVAMFPKKKKKQNIKISSLFRKVSDKLLVPCETTARLTVRDEEKKKSHEYKSAF